MWWRSDRRAVAAGGAESRTMFWHVKACTQFQTAAAGRFKWPLAIDFRRLADGRPGGERRAKVIFYYVELDAAGS